MATINGTLSNFDDVGQFHEKFKLDNVTNHPMKPKLITPELAKFRKKLMREELNEIEEGYAENDLAKVADGLVDLVYVALGTAQLHGLPWQELWDAVQRANMRKERCLLDHVFEVNEGAVDLRKCGVCGQAKVKHSVRGNVNDVIKPEGWTPPDIVGVLSLAGWPGPPLPLVDEGDGA